MRNRNLTLRKISRNAAFLPGLLFVFSEAVAQKKYTGKVTGASLHPLTNVPVEE